MENEELIIKTGEVSEIIFQNKDNGYTVFDFECEGKLITVVGTFSYIAQGDTLEIAGEFVNHATYGKQLRAVSFKRIDKKSTSDMRRYLSAGNIKGIGPATAEKIVAFFGENTFDVIENEPERLAQIKGITLDKAIAISMDFKSKNVMREIMIKLEKFELKPSECILAYKHLGDRAIEKIEENPYILCSGDIGVNFKKLDSTIFKSKIKVNPTDRQKAAVLFVVSHNTQNGHTCLPKSKVKRVCAEFLSISEDEALNDIDLLINEKQLVQAELDGESFLFLPHLYFCEKSIADRISLMLKFPPAKGRAVEKDIDEIEIKKGIKFEKKQREAIKIAVEKGILVLTGGPGTGKTTTLNGILDMYKKRNLKVVLTAPTGRAAKRMSEVTHNEAKTIHRLLEVVFSDSNKQMFEKNSQNPIDADAVIVDELSMVDVELFWALLDALPLGARLVMVGDSDQLPPVGAGNVLSDIILSGLLPVISLTEVFRQAQKSLIVTNSHKIVGGQMPQISDNKNDFFFMKKSNVFSVSNTVIDLFLTRLKNAYGLDPKNDIQIICPQKKGEVGTISLNAKIQERFNPKSSEKEEITVGANVFRVGDKVMQIKNNYDINFDEKDATGQGIYNGDIGIIKVINQTRKIAKIQFDEKLATYNFDNLRELELAYAITVHKSQGCEFEAVIMPMFSVIDKLSYRNLLYTAITRAKSIIVIVGDENEIKKMVSNDKKMKRYSGLLYFLRDLTDESGDI